MGPVTECFCLTELFYFYLLYTVVFFIGNCVVLVLWFKQHHAKRSHGRTFISIIDGLDLN